VYFLREDGVVPSIVAGAAVLLLTAWWYSRKVKIVAPRLSQSELLQESAGLMKLGLAFMGSAFLMMGSAYVVRIIILRQVGLDAAGHYQAAWTLGGLYVGFILQTLGTDFYPRLVGVAGDNRDCNRLVNEQAHVSLLLAGPGVIATLTLSQFVIEWFYSAQFQEAVAILRWISLGMALRIITWPIAYIIIAKNRQALFFITELAWTLVNLGLTWLCVRSFGVQGAGIAFFGAYVFHAAMIYPVVRGLSGFRWTSVNASAGGLFILSIGAVFCGFQVLPPLWATVFGCITVMLTTLHSARSIVTLVAPDRLPAFVSRLLLVERLVR
jgi:PST family polysaccharide transporter